jgi:hypothetical protein
MSMTDPRVEGELARRPDWALMPPAPIQPKPQSAPLNPHAPGQVGKRGVDWAITRFSQDAEHHSERQPRDDDGKWTDEGSGATTTSETQRGERLRRREPYQTTRAIRGKYKEAEEKAKRSGEEWDGMSSTQREKWFNDHPGKFRILDRKLQQPFDQPYRMGERADGSFIIQKEVESYGGSQDPYFKYYWKTVGDPVANRATAERRFNEFTDPDILERQDAAKEARKRAEWEAGAPEREARQLEREARERAAEQKRQASLKPLNPEMQKLSDSIEKLPDRDAEFAQNLVDYFQKHGKLTPNQQPWVDRLMSRAEQGKDTELEKKIDELRSIAGLALTSRDLEFANSLVRQFSDRGQLSDKQKPFVDKLLTKARKSKLPRDSAMWTTPTFDWNADWRPPHWDDDKANDRAFSEDNINRDKAGKWAAQRQLPRARDKQWRSPSFNQPTTSERHQIEDARIKALDMARQILGHDTYRVRIAGDSACGLAYDSMPFDLMTYNTMARYILNHDTGRFGMAFDRALPGHELRSQTMKLAMDFVSQRTISHDGHLHVGHNRISRAQVSPYLGKEIPDSEQLGLNPNQRYMLLRHPDELAKAAASFNGIPILIDHRPISADDHPSNLVVGTTGTDSKYEHPFLTNSLHFWDQNAIDAINNNSRRELSCAYHYVPVMQPGVYEGKQYDGVMTQIGGNHVALVEDGRVGPSAVVADAMPLDLTIRNWFNPR